MDYSVKNESVGSGFGFGGGLWGIIILVLIFLFFRDGRFGFGGNGDGNCGGYCHPKPLVPADCCEVLKSGYDTQKVEVYEAEKTRAMIERKWDIEQLEKFQTNLALIASKDAKIAQLENNLYNDAKFGKVYAELGELKCNMPRTAPCYIPTCGSCHFPPDLFRGEARRCEC